MTYAVIEICGKQLKVEAGRFYDLDRINQDVDSEVTVDKVLLVHHEDELIILYLPLIHYLRLDEFYLNRKIYQLQLLVACHRFLLLRKSFFFLFYILPYR